MNDLLAIAIAAGVGSFVGAAIGLYIGCQMMIVAVKEAFPKDGN